MVVPGKFKLTYGAHIMFQLVLTPAPAFSVLSGLPEPLRCFRVASTALVSSELGIRSWGAKQPRGHLRPGPVKADWELLRQKCVVRTQAKTSSQLIQVKF